MPLLPLALFALTYLALALGRLPGLKLDRAGFGAGADLTRPATLVPTVALLGNLVGNVPAVMLLLPFVGREPATGYALALASTFAGNAVLVGSIANLIVAEQAERLGIRFGFREHLSAGLPVTLISLALAVAAISLW